MHKNIEWDAPGNDSAAEKFHTDAPYPGAILSAHYRSCNVRVKVEAYIEDDAVSIGTVVALIDAHGKRHEEFHDLSLGDMVRLPDDKRSLERWEEEEEEN